MPKPVYEICEPLSDEQMMQEFDLSLEEVLSLQEEAVINSSDLVLINGMLCRELD